jgi:hypothetical protein
MDRHALSRGLAKTPPQSGTYLLHRHTDLQLSPQTRARTSGRRETLDNSYRLNL